MDVFQDLFTPSVELMSLRSADAKGVIKALEDLVIFRWGAPEYLLTDNDREFENKQLKQRLNEYGIEYTTTPPYHPQANLVERSNHTLRTMIATFVGADHREWYLYVHEFRNAINSATQVSMNVPLAFLNFGRHLAPVKSLRRELELKAKIDLTDPATWCEKMKRLDALQELVVKSIDTAKKR